MNKPKSYEQLEAEIERLKSELEKQKKISKAWELGSKRIYREKQAEVEHWKNEFIKLVNESEGKRNED